jgi:polysaccharide export outer membrane protein
LFKCFSFLLSVDILFVMSGPIYSSAWAQANSGPGQSSEAINSQVYPDDDRDYTFTPGTAIEVTIWQEPDLSGDFSIDSKGYVILPLIGKVNVGRYTSESLESYLEEEYSSYLRNPIIQTLPLIRVSVVGNVRAPGLYRVEPDRPFWDIIAMAGGPTERGDITRMFVMRGGEIVNQDLLSAYERGVSMQEIGIQSGDQIMIPRYKGPFPWRMIISISSLSVSIWAIATRRR